MTPEERAAKLWDAIEADWPTHPDDGKVRDREVAIMATAIRARSASEGESK